MKYFKKDDFNPDVFHPYYFIRKCLRGKIESKAHLLKGKMLDFGCGSKPYKDLFNVEEYIGVDFENEGHPHDGDEIDVYYDGKSLPFADNYFDSILTTEVFEHIFNLPDLLQELKRVLKPGGVILITCPFVWNEHEVPYDYARYTKFALQDLLNKSGFEISSIEKSGNFVMALSQLQVLYLFQTFYFKFNKIFIARWIFTFFFIAMPNIAGILLNWLLPNNTTLYLNNVVVASKTK